MNLLRPHYVFTWKECSSISPSKKLEWVEELVAQLRRDFYIDSIGSFKATPEAYIQSGDTRLCVRLVYNGNSEGKIHVEVREFIPKVDYHYWLDEFK